MQADSLRAALDSIFASPDYRWVERPSPLEFLTRWFQGLQHWLLALREAHPTGYRLLLLLVVLLLVVIVLHAAWILFHTVRSAGGEGVPAGPSAPRRDAAWYRAEAERLAAQGRYAEAMQADFLGLVRALDRFELLRFHPGKTPAEYSREARLDPGAGQAFRDLVGALYGYAFAGWPCGAEDYARWRELSGVERYARPD